MSWFSMYVSNPQWNRLIQDSGANTVFLAARAVLCNVGPTSYKWGYNPYEQGFNASDSFLM